MTRFTQRAVVAGAMLLALSVPAIAQAPKTDEDYDKIMKQVGATMGVVRKSMDAAPADAAKGAEQLAAMFKDVHAFWTARKVADAAATAEAAMKHSAALAKALGSKDTNAAAEASKALGGTCQSCHTAHRDKAPDGGWRIKPAA